MGRFLRNPSKYLLTITCGPTSRFDFELIIQPMSNRAISLQSYHGVFCGLVAVQPKCDIKNRAGYVCFYLDSDVCYIDSIGKFAFSGQFMNVLSERMAMFSPCTQWPSMG